MPYKKYRRRRRRKRRKASVHTVRKIVKKEVGKTRELKKLVSFVMERPIRTLNTAFIGSANTPWENTMIYSLTGGRMSNGFDSNDVINSNNTPSSMFSLRPAFTGKVQLAGQGGQVDSNANTTQESKTAGGVHILQGRQCYLKNFYCNLRISNQGHQGFTTPGGTIILAEDPQTPIAQHVRILVIETRRPLYGMRSGGAYNSLASQIFLQLHAGDGTGAQVPNDINCDGVTGFLNFEIIKKVIYDKLLWMGDGDKGTSRTQFVKRLKVRLNKKAYWNYNYDVQDPSGEPVLKYNGPWFYMLMFGSNLASNDLDVCPRVNMSSILTLYDD